MHYVLNSVGEREWPVRTPLLISTDCVTSLLGHICILLCSYVFTCALSKGSEMYLFMETQGSRPTTRQIHRKIRLVTTCRSQHIEPYGSLSERTRKEVVYLA